MTRTNQPHPLQPMSGGKHRLAGEGSFSIVSSTEGRRRISTGLERFCNELAQPPYDLLPPST